MTGALPTAQQKQVVTFTGTLPKGSVGASAGGKVVVEKVCQYADRAANTPALFSAFADDSNYKLTEVRQERQNTLCKITLTYTYDVTADAISTLSTPATTYVEQSSTIEAPITQHPKWKDGTWNEEFNATKDGFLPSSDKHGIESYLVGTCTVTVTNYSITKPSSLRGSIGTIQDPGGDFTGESKWLLIGANRTKQGGFWAHSKTYLFRPIAWSNEGVYG